MIPGHSRSAPLETIEGKSRGAHACREIISGSARVSDAGFCVSPKQSFLWALKNFQKSVMARRHHQHARRARYPGKPVCDRLLLLTYVSSNYREQRKPK